LDGVGTDWKREVEGDFAAVVAGEVEVVWFVGVGSEFP
jgi:hypothetical protein